MKCLSLILFIFLTLYSYANENEKGNKKGESFLLGFDKVKWYSSQSKNYSVDTTAYLKRLNTYKHHIDSILTDLDSSKVDTYQSAEGGILKSYFEQADTLKQEIIHFGETGKRLLSIYFINSNPVMILDTKVYYENPIGASKEIKVINKIKNVYYINKKQELIYWEKDGKKMSPSLYKDRIKDIPL